MMEVEAERVEIALDLLQGPLVEGGELGGCVTNELRRPERLKHLAARRIQAVVDTRVKVEDDRLVDEFPVDNVVGQ